MKTTDINHIQFNVFFPRWIKFVPHLLLALFKFALISLSHYATYFILLDSKVLNQPAASKKKEPRCLLSVIYLDEVVIHPTPEAVLFVPC